MLVVMQAQATEEQVRAVCQKIESLGYRAHSMPGAQRTAIGITGNKGEVDPGIARRNAGRAGSHPRFQALQAGQPRHQARQHGHQVSRRANAATIGGPDLAIIAGPCGIESREQAFAIAERVARAGAQFFRGGAYKPRTSPYSFQGLGEEGLKIMAEIRDRFGLLIVTEAVDYESLDLVDQYADMIQIGARNMQNFSLLKRAGRARKPVLLKRGMSATLEEFLMAAEYIMSEGNYNVILCERGVRTFADHTRNTLDLSIVPAVQRLSHLPIIVDPSHGTGKRNKVTPLSRAAVAVGADGLIVEVHHDPDRALSDGMQSLFPDQFDALMVQVRQIAAVLGRGVPLNRGQIEVTGVGGLSLAQIPLHRRSHPARPRRRLVLLPRAHSPRLRAALPRIRLHHEWEEQHGYGDRPAQLSSGAHAGGGHGAYRTLRPIPKRNEVYVVNYGLVERQRD